jgi:tripartite-type tricarboxylate transporter receptor subunit TctC
MVVPFPPGGGADAQARNLAERLAQRWKQPVVIDNVSGAGGAVAANKVARSRPDGLTIFFLTHPILSINPLLASNLPYDPVKDFAPIIRLLSAPLVLMVPADSPIRSVSDLVRTAKEKPGVLNFGSGGLGTTQHLAAELLQSSAGVSMTHVPYRGNAQTITALVSNEIQLFFDGVPSASNQMKGGRVRGVAVTSEQRLAGLPELPTVAETLPGFEVTLAYGLAAPAGTPSELIARINADCAAVIREASFMERAARDGATVHGGSAAEFADFLASERRKWGEVARRLNQQKS